MFSRGRGGPSRSTPANVQCQKCLKRGHYSYECKETAQNRPYVSRPSRSQQLRNPKLVPKLTEATLDPVEAKKGVADEVLQKREAERARKRDLDGDNDEDDDGALILSEPKRKRSESFSSVSTISTEASNRSHETGRRRRASRSPPPTRARGDTRGAGSNKGRDNHGNNRSRSPTSRDTNIDRPLYRSRNSRDDENDRQPRRERRYSSVSVSSRDSRPRHRHSSRSPGANTRVGGHTRALQQGSSDHRTVHPQRGGMDGSVRARSPPRERSLSPFSKRVAMGR